MSKRTPFTQEDVEEILRVVDRLTDVEVTLETGDIKLHVRKGVDGSARAAEAHFGGPAPAGTPAAPRAARTMAPRKLPDIELPGGAVAIRAPILGTFYRAPSPAEPPYVEVGKHVSVGDPVCIIEVMKLFNTVNATVNGTIAKIVVENGAMVEFNQVLFVVQPDQ